VATRANPTNPGTDVDRGVADFLLDFPFELPLKASSSAAYGSLPRPEEPGLELRPSPSCDVVGFQWR